MLVPIILSFLSSKSPSFEVEAVAVVQPSFFLAFELCMIFFLLFYSYCRIFKLSFFKLEPYMSVKRLNKVNAWCTLSSLLLFKSTDVVQSPAYFSSESQRLSFRAYHKWLRALRYSSGWPFTFSLAHCHSSAGHIVLQGHRPLKGPYGNTGEWAGWRKKGQCSQEEKGIMSSCMWGHEWPL